MAVVRNVSATSRAGVSGAYSKEGLIGLHFEVAGMAPLARVMGAKMAAVRDLRPVWDDIRNDFIRREAALFRAQGAVPGNPGWAALSEEYAAYKARKGFSPRIMVRGGRLLHSLTDPAAADFVFDAGPLRMTIGTRVPYAIYHQDPRQRGRMKRPVIVINDPMRRHWVKLIQAFLVESGQLERMDTVRPARSGYLGSRARARRSGRI